MNRMLGVLCGVRKELLEKYIHVLKEKELIFIFVFEF